MNTLIYDSKLNVIDLDPNKLFAMIVYKNIFPKDFSMLQMNLGYVKEVFDKKTKITEVIERQSKRRNRKFKNRTINY